MNTKTKLLIYMQEKSDILKEYAPDCSPLYTTEDYLWATNLSNREASKIMHRILSISFYGIGFNRDTCPQCIMYTCRNCPYSGKSTKAFFGCAEGARFMAIMNQLKANRTLGKAIIELSILIFTLRCSK